MPLRHVVLAAAAAVALAAGPALAEPVTIKILQVNDWDRIQEQDGRGGYARFRAVLERENAAAPEVLLVHAGDAISPSLLSGFDKGAHIVDLLNQVPLDVFVMGNHEFDFGPDVAKERLREARFPVLNSNVTDRDGSLFAGTTESRVIEVAGFRLGFFGMTTPDTTFLASPGYAGFRPVLETAAAMAKGLREQGADLVVAVTHTGFGDDLALMRQGEVDLILTGHDHDLRVIYDGDVAMVESGAQAEYVTAVDLTLDRVKDRDGKESVVWRPSFRTIDTAAVAPDPKGAELVAAYEARLSAELDVPVGTTATELDSRRAAVRGREAAIGNLIADAMREAVGADVAITNGGGIRADKLYPAGTTLTRRDVLSELPFGNKTVKLEVKGADILAALENGLSQAEEGGGGRFPQVSGMTVAYDVRRPARSRVVEVKVGGRPLDPAATYTLATNDYMARGGDGYAALAGARNLIDPAAARLMASQVIDHVAGRGTVSPKVEGRIVRVE
jgi:5'-nucleotidase / UDP-sugar diphosphatase